MDPADVEELRAQNTELGRELERAAARESAVRDVGRALAQPTFDLNAVLQTVVDQAVELSHAELGNLLLGEGDTFRVVAFRSFTPEYERIVRERIYKPERDSVMGRALLERSVVQILDVLDDPEYTLAEIQRVGNFRTIVGVPLLREDEPIGAIAVGRSEVLQFDEAEIRLLETFADYVVIAIENARLFETVERQRTELARFAPQVADLLSSAEGEQLLAGHRREITAVFCDLRGFTAFAETAEPEEVLGVLREYHTAVGESVLANKGTVEHFAGDGLMAFFNDPVSLPEHQLAAVRTAEAVTTRFSSLAADWQKRGYDLGLGIGIATGYSTLGRIGFEGRYDYGAVGTAVILASRLADAAAPGEILMSQRTHAAIDDRLESEHVPELRLKGFGRPVMAMRMTALRDA